MPNRRTFLTSSLGVAVLGGVVPSALMQSAALAQAYPTRKADPENVLVVVQMQGGNDGLNMVVPYSDDAYYRARPTIAIPRSQVLRIDDRIGFNPALAPLQALHAAGRLALVQGVGYPNPNRSHFEATQIWETGSTERVASTGWLGRYLDRVVPAGANGTASLAPGSLFAGVSLGDVVPTALLAQHVDVPAVGTLANYAYQSGRDVAGRASAGVLFDGARTGSSPYLGLIEETARAAYHGGDVLRAQTAGFTNAATYGKDAFSAQMALAARIIGSRVGTRIIFVSIGSFDTHANQRPQQDRLLGSLATGLAAFEHDLTAHGLAERVLTMTFSEFGRRVNQSASNGTDHGTAMPLFVMGGGVRGGVFGAHPSLTELDPNGDLLHHTDFRSVYATVLGGWLGADASAVVGAAYPSLAFL